MGQITIKIPQPLNKIYRIISEDSAQEVLLKIENMVKRENEIKDDEILGLWADREESAEEIAKNLRDKSNNRNLKDD